MQYNKSGKLSRVCIIFYFAQIFFDEIYRKKCYIDDKFMVLLESLKFIASLIHTVQVDQKKSQYTIQPHINHNNYIIMNIFITSLNHKVFKHTGTDKKKGPCEFENV